MISRQTFTFLSGCRSPEDLSWTVLDSPERNLGRQGAEVSFPRFPFFLYHRRMLTTPRDREKKKERERERKRESWQTEASTGLTDKVL